MHLLAGSHKHSQRRGDGRRDGDDDDCPDANGLLADGALELLGLLQLFTAFLDVNGRAIDIQVDAIEDFSLLLDEKRKVNEHGVQVRHVPLQGCELAVALLHVLQRRLGLEADALLVHQRRAVLRLGACADVGQAEAQLLHAGGELLAARGCSVADLGKPQHRGSKLAGESGMLAVADAHVRRCAVDFVIELLRGNALKLLVFVAHGSEGRADPARMGIDFDHELARVTRKRLLGLARQCHEQVSVLVLQPVDALVQQDKLAPDIIHLLQKFADVADTPWVGLRGRGALGRMCRCGCCGGVVGRRGKKVSEPIAARHRGTGGSSAGRARSQVVSHYLKIGVWSGL
eukprot:m.221381 g.221381  ORF g.221381 m.221381 type:complete len:345 (+) comp10572_c0_seq1:85-1119(+)